MHTLDQERDMGVHHTRPNLLVTMFDVVPKRVGGQVAVM
jgi:hypothetical protein